MAGLVLEPCGNSGRYQRAGRFTLSGVDIWKFSRRFRYKPTSKTPTDGTASFTEVISDLLQSIERSLEGAKSNLEALSHLTTYGYESNVKIGLMTSSTLEPSSQLATYDSLESKNSQLSSS